MPVSNPTAFLRGALLLDAAISGVTGLVMAAGATLLEDLLGVPAALLRPVGLSLLPFAAVLITLARREVLSPSAVKVVIALNALWVVASVLLLVSGQVNPTLVGYAFVIVQAIAVVGFAELQWMGLRRATV